MNSSTKTVFLQEWNQSESPPDYNPVMLSYQLIHHGRKKKIHDAMHVTFNKLDLFECMFQKPKVSLNLQKF